MPCITWSFIEMPWFTYCSQWGFHACNFPALHRFLPIGKMDDWTPPLLLSWLWFFQIGAHNLKFSFVCWDLSANWKPGALCRSETSWLQSNWKSTSKRFTLFLHISGPIEWTVQLKLTWTYLCSWALIRPLYPPPLSDSSVISSLWWLQMGKVDRV